MSADWLLSVCLLVELTIVQSGRCPAPQPAFSFSPIYTPVCGSDNQTYANVEALILRNDQAASGPYPQRSLALVQFVRPICNL